ncbi:MAG: hypothetical protein GX825_01445 [Syntrophomonadaceae bacterium]|nr:hypothetical protein [Syntrophomonadaceae bacterium]
MKKKSFPLRIDPKLYDSLERWAADEFRSVNSQIEYILHNAVAKAGRISLPPPPTDESSEKKRQKA